MDRCELDSRLCMKVIYFGKQRLSYSKETKSYIDALENLAKTLDKEQEDIVGIRKRALGVALEQQQKDKANKERKDKTTLVLKSKLESIVDKKTFDQWRRLFKLET